MTHQAFSLAFEENPASGRVTGARLARAYGWKRAEECHDLRHLFRPECSRRHRSSWNSVCNYPCKFFVVLRSPKGSATEIRALHAVAVEAMATRAVVAVVA